MRHIDRLNALERELKYPCQIKKINKMKLAKQHHPLGNASLMNWFFDDILTQNAFNEGKTNAKPNGFSTPKTNIVKNEEGYYLEIAAPGLRKEDFKIDINENVLSISAERSSENEQEKTNYKSREFNYSSFKRSFTLPEHTDLENISAEYEHGILTMSLPVKEEAKKTLQIAVK